VEELLDPDVLPELELPEFELPEFELLLECELDEFCSAASSAFLCRSASIDSCSFFSCSRISFMLTAY
jgi:hypothetical protein